MTPPTRIPTLTDTLKHEASMELEAWRSVLDSKVLTSVSILIVLDPETQTVKDVIFRPESRRRSRRARRC
jgi:hypothetical protein